MKAEVFPSSIGGTVHAPGSKSIAQRVAVCALLAKGESVVTNYPDSSDCSAAINVIQNLGAIVINRNGTLQIKGGFPNAFHAGIRNPKDEINCGESGLAARIFMAVAALHSTIILVRGEGSLLTRPFHDLENAIKQLGGNVQSNNGLLPAAITGPMVGGKIEMDGSISSQFITALLLSLPKAMNDSELQVSNVTSIPYIQTTIEVMQKFGVEITHENFNCFHIRGGQNYQAQKMDIPGDWSSAAFLLVAGALRADQKSLIVNNISTEITQADAAILEALKIAGVQFQQHKNHVEVAASNIQAFEFDATNCPDLFPPLVALAAFGNGVSTICGVKRLIHKESNRAKVLQEEFAKANIRIVVRENEMKIYPSAIRPAIINAHNDHRIAMAAALLGIAGAKMTIKGVECMAKSYPNFMKDLQLAGAKINLFQPSHV